MKKITTLFVVSLLLTCMYIPCIAAAGNNDGLRAYDAQVNKTIGQARAANVSNGSAGLGMAATAQAIKGASGNGLNVDSSGLYRARDAYRNDRTPENRQMLMDAAKDHLLQMLDLMIERLELLHEQIEFAEEQNILVPEGVSENIDHHILRLEGYKSEVGSTDTEADLRSVARAINQEWGSIRREILHYAKYMIAVRTEAYIDKAGDISDRLDVKISELEDDDVDTTNLRQNLNAFNEKLVCVEDNYERAKIAVSDDELSPSAVRQHIQNTNRCIGEANHILREMFKELRALEGYRDGAVMLNGTGTLKASGSGTAWIHGSLDLALSCDHGTLMVHDRAGNGNITVTGNGAEDQTGRWTIYHGFDGTADITGSDVSVALVGSEIYLTVTGTGRAILVGDGKYQVRGSDDGLISSGDWQEQRDGYELGIEAIVSEEAEYTGDESADEAEDEAAADETVNESADDPANESDSGADEVGGGDADTSGNEIETESGTDDSGVES